MSASEAGSIATDDANAVAGDEHERKCRSQEKNRRAQARFRERQKAKDADRKKKLADYEAKEQEMIADRAKLDEQRAELALHRAELNARSHQLNTLSRSGGPQDFPLLPANVSKFKSRSLPAWPMDTSPTTIMNQQAVPAPPARLDGTYGLGPGTPGWPLAESSSRPVEASHAAETSRGIAMPQYGASGLRSDVATPAAVIAAASYSAAQQVSPHPAQAAGAQCEVGRTGSGFNVVLAADDVPCLDWAEYCKLYKEVMDKISLLLPTALHDPHCHEARLCNTLLQDFLLKNRAIFQRKPSMRDQVHTQPILMPPNPSLTQGPDRRHWQNVVGNLNLTREQQQSTVRLQQQFKQRMASIRSRRRQLGSDLLAASAEPSDGDPSPSYVTNLRLVHESSAAVQIADALKQSLSDEVMSQMEVGQGLMTRVLTPLQACIVFVGVYPWFPDKLAMMDCIVEAEVMLRGNPVPIVPTTVGASFTPRPMSAHHPTQGWPPPP